MTTYSSGNSAIPCKQCGCVNQEHTAEYDSHCPKCGKAWSICQTGSHFGSGQYAICFRACWCSEKKKDWPLTAKYARELLPEHFAATHPSRPENRMPISGSAPRQNHGYSQQGYEEAESELPPSSPAAQPGSPTSSGLSSTTSSAWEDYIQNQWMKDGYHPKPTATTYTPTTSSIYSQTGMHAYAPSSSQATTGGSYVPTGTSTATSSTPSSWSNAPGEEWKLGAFTYDDKHSVWAFKVGKKSISANQAEWQLGKIPIRESGSSETIDRTVWYKRSNSDPKVVYYTTEEPDPWFLA